MRPFADSTEFGQGPEAKTKGVVGPVPLNQAHPALSERLRTSQPGQLLEPFRIDDGFCGQAGELRSNEVRREHSTEDGSRALSGGIQENVLCKLLEISR